MGYHAAIGRLLALSNGDHRIHKLSLQPPPQNRFAAEAHRLSLPDTSCRQQVSRATITINLRLGAYFIRAVMYYVVRAGLLPIFQVSIDRFLFFRGVLIF